MDSEFIKIVSSAFIIMTFVIILFLWLMGDESKSVENKCREQCVSVGQEYVSSKDGYYSEDQCICRKDNEIKNIW